MRLPTLASLESDFLSLTTDLVTANGISSPALRERSDLIANQLKSLPGGSSFTYLKDFNLLRRILGQQEVNVSNSLCSQITENKGKIAVGLVSLAATYCFGWTAGILVPIATFFGKTAIDQYQHRSIPAPTSSAQAARIPDILPPPPSRASSGPSTSVPATTTASTNDQLSILIGTTNVVLKQGDLLREDVPAIVNPANERCLGGGFLDGAIHAAAGRGLFQECLQLPIRSGTTNVRCPTGEAVITGSGNLAARGIQSIIHTVGPVYNTSNPAESRRLLYNAYFNTLRVAQENGIRRIAIPAISAGVFGYPVGAATQVALEAIGDYLGQHPGHFTEIRLVFFGADTYTSALSGLMDGLSASAPVSTQAPTREAPVMTRSSAAYPIQTAAYTGSDRWIKFYLGLGPDDMGRTLPELLAQSNDAMENSHNYIQRLFFNRDGSTPILTHEIEYEFRSGPHRDVLKNNLRQAFVRMMHFYGFVYEGGSVRKNMDPTSPNSFENRKQWLWINGKHNYLRITRIITCLRMLGLGVEANAFYAALSSLYNDPTPIRVTGTDRTIVAKTEIDAMDSYRHWSQAYVTYHLVDDN